MAGKITINAERCKSCGLCVAICPKNCITFSKESNKNGYFPATASKDDCCIGCCQCAIVCPDAVIEVCREMKDIPIATAPSKKKRTMRQIEEKA